MKEEKEDYTFKEEWHEPTFKSESLVKRTIILALKCIWSRFIDLMLICGIEAFLCSIERKPFVLGTAIAYWLITELIVSIWNDVEEKKKGEN